MKPHTLPIKRRPVQKGVFHKLSAVTRSRKQRVAAAAPAGEMEAEDGSSRISRALTIIFLIHIVAVGLIFFHNQFLDGRGIDTSITSEVASAASAPAAAPAVVAPAPRTREALPRLSTGDKVYVVKPGDNYERIAEREGVEVSALREANQHIEIRPGLILSVPPRRIVAEEPAELVRMRENQNVAAATPADEGLVPAIDINAAPRATPVAATPAPAAVESAAAPTGRKHVVKSGDNIWRISQQYKVKQDDLMKLDKITDARKVRIGMELVIPD